MDLKLAIQVILADIEQTLREAHGGFRCESRRPYYVGKGIGLIDAVAQLPIDRATRAKLMMYERAFYAIEAGC